LKKCPVISSVIEQTHQIVQSINEALEDKQYCSAAFLDISQAFDKVWHTGILYKLRLSLPLNYFLVLKSYLHSRHFLLKDETEFTELSPSQCGHTPRQCPSATIMPVIHCRPVINFTRIYHSNFVNDTAVLAMDSDPAIASQKLQTNLAAIQNWFKSHSPHERKCAPRPPGSV
jgi:hypothetical protein